METVKNIPSLEEWNKQNLLSQNILEIISNKTFGVDGDVRGYKWKLVDETNEPTKVEFYTEDNTESMTIHLSHIMEVWTKVYQSSLEEVDRQEKQKEFDEKLKELVKSYELFVIKSVKDNLIERELKPNITNIRSVIDSHWFDRQKPLTKDWFVENDKEIRHLGVLENGDFDPSKRSEMYGLWKPDDQWGSGNNSNSVELYLGCSEILNILRTNKSPLHLELENQIL